MDEKLLWDGPCKSYTFGVRWEIRDKYNQPIIRAEVLKGNLDYRRKMEQLMPIIAGLMNGELWIEPGETPRLQGFGVSITPQPVIVSAPINEGPVVDITFPKEVLRGEFKKPEVKEPDMHDQVDADGEPVAVVGGARKKGGRPKGSKNK